MAQVPQVTRSTSFVASAARRAATPLAVPRRVAWRSGVALPNAGMEQVRWPGRWVDRGILGWIWLCESIFPLKKQLVNIKIAGNISKNCGPIGFDPYLSIYLYIYIYYNIWWDLSPMIGKLGKITRPTIRFMAEISIVGWVEKTTFVSTIDGLIQKDITWHTHTSNCIYKSICEFIIANIYIYICVLCIVCILLFADSLQLFMYCIYSISYSSFYVPFVIDLYD